ncbi:DUF397 domain-containing protein [Streptomyces sp. NWU49]|uniref:DUF397 domain-containing protein n=1 Tax=Streptomyces sp. NWU49 TaxID=2201153 RepID=UPI000D678DCA|nr:DUF397 domain-containing protein [Streptomyces sp. NWU49]PWJ07488.1 DUF397 domain-containing protein [Streptomyces sp. NWU49]
MATPGIWKKSSYSGGGEGNACVEVALRHPRIAIRDSKNSSHGTLSVPAPAFAAFVGALREREGRPV